MIDIAIKYQASIFVNVQDITPTPAVVGALITLFSDKPLIPTTYQGFTFGEGTRLSPVRIRLTDPNNEWAVTFATDRIDIDQNAIDVKGSNLSDLNRFFATVVDLFTRILTRFPKKANRLAFNSAVLLNEMKEAELDLAYTRLLTPPRFYQVHKPFEWKWRTAAHTSMRINDLEEVLNIIADISRLKGALQNQTTEVQFDRLKLFFDINTTDQNQEYRFELPQIRYFFEHINDLHESLSNEFQEYINA